MLGDGLFSLCRKDAECRACEVKGRCLAPAIWQFDNLVDVARLLEMAMVPYEEWSGDHRSGMLHIPGLGGVRIGGYLVLDGGRLSAYESREDMLKRYDVVLESS